MDEGTEFWFWAAPDGSLKTVDEGELKSALSRGQIPAKAFVWRPGWGEWLRAAQVGELSLSVPAGQRVPTVKPSQSPDMTQPPPVPTDVKGVVLAPIVPVASNPINDRPQTQVLDDVEIEISVTDMEPVKAPAAARQPKSAPPPPSRRSSPPSPPSAAGKPPSAPPPVKNWLEVKDVFNAPAIDDAPLSDRTETSLEPIVPVDSSPSHEPVTGSIGDEEIQIIEASAGAGVKEAVEPPKVAVAPPKVEDKPVPVPASVPSLDKLAASVEAKKAPRPSPVVAVGPQAIPPAAKLAPMPAAAVVVSPTPMPPAAGLAPAPQPVAPVPVAARPPVAPAPVVMAPVPTPVVIAPASVEPDLSNAIIPVSEPEHDAPTQLHASALLPTAGEAAPLPAWEVEEAPAPAQLPPPPRLPQGSSAAPQASPSYAPSAYPSYAPPRKKSALPLILGAMGVMGLFGVAAVGALLYFKPWKTEDSAAETRKSAAVAAPSAPATAAPTGPSCVIAHEAKLLAPSIALSVPPYVAPLGADKVAIGFAATPMTGVGLEVETGSLEVHQALSNPGAGKVVGVVPVSEKPGFVVDREGGKLGVPHSIDAESPFAVGFGPTGYARLPKDGGLDVIWAGVGNEKATEARVASVAGVGHVVTFRTGGQVRVGWLKPNGMKKTELSAVDAEGSRVGNPTIAANDGSILIAFAAKSGDGAWGVQLSSAKHGDTPTQSVRFAIPAGGPGGDAIAPVAAGLPGGRWLLQWTEGGAGERVVRAQTLDSKLAPVGDALKLSAAGKEAGQGVVAVNGDRAVSLQLVKGDQSYQLWGTALSCK